MRDLEKGEKREIRGFDTETLHGYVKVITCSDGSVKEPDYIENILSYLTQKKYRDSINFFYNIQYDLDSILKFLPESDLREIVLQGKIKYGGYTLFYIPKKMFSVKLGKDTYTYYDLFQFYETSLERAAHKYVQGVKNEDNLDRSLIGSSGEYWKENKEKIIKYCIQDSKLTAQLGELLQEVIHETCGFYPKRYVSKAGLSKRYFREFCDIPSFNQIPEEVQKFAFNAYHGGRFEVTERGKCGKCTSLDISSAYPYWISQLIDVRRGRWKRSMKLNPSAYYGFYLAEVNIPYQYLPPLAYRWHNTVIFPCGSWMGYFTKEELEVLEEVGSYKVWTGWEFYPDQIVYPFKEAIEKLYEKKNTTPKEDFRYSLFKILMNSFYGSLYEKVKQRSGKYKAGLLFFPVYATLITANTRLQLWKKAREFGKNCISMATDGLLIKGEIDHPNDKTLGGWENEGCGEVTILRSGIFSFGEEFKQRGVMKSRYYNTPHGKFENLFEYIEKYPEFTSYPILQNRPVHASESVHFNKRFTKDDINIFKDFEVAFDLNTEIKRVYDHPKLTGKTLLKNNYKSMPHFVDQGKL